MAEIALKGKMKVKTLKAEFKKVFGATLRVYNDVTCRGEYADDNATLASIRTEGAKGGEFSVKGNMHIGNFEKKVADLFGIGIQVANANDSELIDNNITLSQAATLSCAENLTHIRVELTANEGEYAAFDTNENMLGETFAFQRDAGVFRLEVYIDGVANEKYAEKLSDNEIFTDYEDFNLQWDEEFEVVKRFDNIAVYSWDFDVEDFDIAKLQLIFTCYDVVLESSDYSEESHCPVLKYDGQEIEQNEILSENKDCEEIWNLWEQLDADEDCEDED